MSDVSRVTFTREEVSDATAKALSELDQRRTFLAAHREQPPGTITARDAAKHWGIADRWARERIRQMIDDGEMEVAGMLNRDGKAVKLFRVIPRKPKKRIRC